MPAKKYPTPLELYLEHPSPRVYRVNEVPEHVPAGMMALAPPLVAEASGPRIFLGHANGNPCEYYLAPKCDGMP